MHIHSILADKTILYRSKAIESNPEAQSLEQVMEWLIAHEDELNAVGPSTSKNNTTTSKAPVQPTVSSQSTSSKTTDMSAQPVDDFRPEETAAETAARKKITVEEAQRLIIERQKIRAEEDRKKAIEDEKKRRQDGQKMIQTRAELEDQERIRLAQQIRQEKLEKELHRKKILEQIALDRENMKNRNKPATESPAKSSPSAAGGNGNGANNNKSPPTECRLALRFPDGTSKVQKFSHLEPLSAVRLFVQMEKTSSQTAKIEFIAPPNRKLADQQMQETLESLGLCPASRLEVKYNRSEMIDLD